MKIRSRCKLKPSKFSLYSAIATLTALAVTPIAAISMVSTALAASDTPTISASTAQTTTPGANTSTTVASQSEVGLKEITVTARRVEENVERVPLAITTYTPQSLVEQDIRSIADITNSLPGVEQCCGTTGQLIYFRGIVNGSPTYFADAPAPPNGYAYYFDVQNISVLKGPQGTLFGQASNAGAFVIVPTKPGTELGGTFSLEGGDFGRRVVSGAFNVPFLDGRILTRLAAESFYRAGYIHDLSNGDEYGDQNYYILRPSVTIKITDNLQNYTLFQYTHSQDTGDAAAEEPYDYNFQPPSQLPILGAEALFNGGNLAAFNALRGQVIATQNQLGYYQILGTSASCASSSSPAQVTTPITSLNYHPVACPGDWENDRILVNTTTWDFLPNWTLKNIASTTWGDSYSSPGEYDQSLLSLLGPQSTKNTYAIPLTTTRTDEAQILGKVGRFSFQGGTFNTEHHTDPAVVYAETFGAPAASRSYASGWSHALYGQTTVDLNDLVRGLTYTLGARQDWDQVYQWSSNLDPNTLSVLSTEGGPNSPSGIARFHNLSYTTSVQYQYTPDTMYYLTLARGYSAGGLQNIVGFPSYQPDVLTNLEGGVKSTFDIHGVETQVNVDIYNGWFDNDQVQNFALVTNSTTGQLTAEEVVQNAAKAFIRGVDLDYAFVLTQNFELRGFASYIDAAYTKWNSVNPNTNQPDDLSDTPWRDVPRWKIGIRPTYHVGLSTYGDLFFNLNYTYRTLIIEATEPLVPTTPGNPRTGLICSRQRTLANGYPAIIADGTTVYVDCSPAEGNLDAGVDWTSFLGHENLTASVQMTNITNNVILDTRANLDPQLGTTALAVAPPRMIWGTLKYSF